jgi:two-component system chemotaxis response regulator CheB
VQHRQRDPTQRLVGLLQEHTRLVVREACAGQPIEAGSLYIAPPDYHLLCDEQTLEIDVDEPVAAARPSIDVLFESAAEAWGPRLMAVLLTGSSRDGLKGLEAVLARGGHVMVQDPEDAESEQAVRWASEHLGVATADAEGLGEAVRDWGRAGWLAAR